MTIHAYYGDVSHLKNEQKMFEDLLTQLKLHWGNSEDWIYLFYNTMWSGQEIDVIAFTKEAIVVIDLKNYSGNLVGSENGEWQINGELEVQGGSQINPFVQIRKNRFAVLEWFKSAELFTDQNLGFISGCIILNELSSTQMDLSHSVRKWFYVTDIANSVDTLSRLHTKGISLASDDIVYLVNKLKLKEYSWDQGVAPRERNLIQSDDRDTPSDNSRDQSSAPIKYTLHDQMEKKFKGVLAPYLFFYGTVIICLAIAFHIANGMKGEGVGYLFSLIFGR